MLAGATPREGTVSIRRAAVAGAEHRDAVGAGVDRVEVAAVAAELDGALAPAERREAGAAGRERARGGERAVAAARSNRCTVLPAGSLVCV